MSDLLVVCTANVCRSPLAQRRLQRALEPRGVAVGSAGTRAMTGSAMCPVSARRLDDGDPFPAAHRARQLAGESVADAALVLTMEREHRSAAVRAAPGSQAKVFTLREALLLGGALEERRAAAVDGLPGLAAAMHALRGLVAPPPPSPQSRRWFRRPPEPPDPLTVVDGHGMDDALHAAATGEVLALADAFAALVLRRLA